MKLAMNSRLKKLESALKSNRRHKSAVVICDPEILHTFDCSQIDADVVLLLPDNGRRDHGQEIPPGSYIAHY